MMMVVVVVMKMFIDDHHNYYDNNNNDNHNFEEHYDGNDDDTVIWCMKQIQINVYSIMQAVTYKWEFKIYFAVCQNSLHILKSDGI